MGYCTGGDGGSVTSQIFNCYSACEVIGTTDKGGLVGYLPYRTMPPSIFSCYWDIQASGLNQPCWDRQNNGTNEIASDVYELGL